MFNYLLQLFDICRFTVVHRTEVIKKTLNPTWNVMTLPVRALCNGDYDRLVERHEAACEGTL